LFDILITKRFYDVGTDLFVKNINMYGNSFDPYSSQQHSRDWPKPPFGIPETVKAIQDWKKSTHMVLYGTIQEGKKWHKSAAELFLDHYMAMIMSWICFKLDKRSTLTRRSVYAGVSLAAPSSPQRDAASKTPDETLMTIRSLFAADPFGTTTTGVDALGHKLLFLHRSAYDKALVYFVKDIVTVIIRRKIAIEFRIRGEALKWKQVRAILMADLQHQPLAYYVEKLVSDIRPANEDIVDWLGSRQALFQDLLRLWGTPDGNFHSMNVHYALRQISDEEQRLLQVP